MGGQPIGQILHLGVDRIVVVRRGAAHHVAVDVAASAGRGKFDFVDSADGLLQISLRHAVQLQSLAAGDSQRACRQLIAQIEFRQQLVGRQFSARNFRPDHENVLPGAFATFFVNSLFAIVLLIGAVKLQQGRVVFVELVAALAQLVGNGAAQEMAVRLDRFGG